MDVIILSPFLSQTAVSTVGDRESIYRERFQQLREYVMAKRRKKNNP